MNGEILNLSTTITKMSNENRGVEERLLSKLSEQSLSKLTEQSL